MKKQCALCWKPARISCESDEASLCWDCDNKVHTANFLVEKHVRCLLCHVCQTPTSWKGFGPKLCHTISICESCVKCNKNEIPEEEDEEDDEEAESQNEEECDSEEGENQVVPWPSTPPPPVAESSEEGCGSEINLLKRRRDQSHELEDETMCSTAATSTSGVNGGDDEKISKPSFKRLKRRSVVGREMVDGIRRSGGHPAAVE